MNEEYEAAKKVFDDALVVENLARVETGKARRALLLAKKDYVIACANGHESRLGELELITEHYNGRFSYSDDDWTYATRKYWVCPTCTETMTDMVNEDFPDGIGPSCKALHEWDSDNHRLTGRLLELLGPSIERRRVAQAKLETDYKLEEARKLLRKAGEL